MNLLSLTTDNITDLLVKIIEFTQLRQKIITQNINNIHKLGFVPKDLRADEFSESLNNAVAEHIVNQRLVLYDTKNVKFGAGGSFEAKPVIDHDAKKLLEKNSDEYLEQQTNKLLENSLNQRVAAELLRQKQGMVSIFE